jgi:hypothetical protein
MTYSSSSALSEQAAAPPRGGPGCLFGFFLPPLAVVVLGLGLFGGSVDAAASSLEATPTPAVQVQAQEGGGEEGAGGIAPLFTDEVRHWEEKIVKWSARYGLDPNLVATVMQIESCGDPEAVSSAGAAGLFQVMPFHFQPGEDSTHPWTNARRGLAYLRQSLQEGGSTRLALAGYNGGITGAKRPESQWPAETRRYVYWGVEIYRDAQAGQKRSPRLEEWLASGGASLCRQAARRLK